MDEVRALNEVLWERYENGKTYLESSGIGPGIRRCVDFFEGRQWPAATKATAGLPRPVVNVVKMVARAKCASVLATPVKLVYQSATSGMRDINEFSHYIRKEMSFDRLRRKAFISGVVKGTYVYHFYWDKEGRGMDGLQEGCLRCEILNPLRVFFADPTEIDEQKQRWILIVSRESVDSVRAKADAGVRKDEIVPDEKPEDGEKEQDGTKMVTVLTQYFRRDGEVWCIQSTRSVVFRAPFRLTPDVDAAMSAVKKTWSYSDEDGDGTTGEDAANNSVPDAAGKADRSGKPLVGHESRMYLYPLVVASYEPREGSIYGIGEVEGLIPNQRIINYNLAMITLNNQQMAWNKWAVAPNALKGQKITNEPGQVLTDYSQTGNGIKALTVPGISGQVNQLVDTLLNLTRVVSGSTEVMTGETLGASMSGAAIAQLQSQAQAPIKDLRTDEWEAQERVGRVLAQFYINYYSGAQYISYRKPTEEEKALSKETGPDGESVVRLEKDGMIAEQKIFDGQKYRGEKIDVAVQATAGTNASAAGDIQMLSDLMGAGAISPKTFVRLYPDDAVSDKTSILEIMDAEEQSELAEMRNQIAALTAQLEQAMGKLKEDAEAIGAASELTNQLANMRKMLLVLYAEASKKIEAQNEEIMRGNASLNETVGDAQMMAQMLSDNVPGVREAVDRVRAGEAEGEEQEAL